MLLFLYFPDIYVILLMPSGSYTKISFGKLSGIFLRFCGPVPVKILRPIMAPIIKIIIKRQLVKQAFPKPDLFLFNSSNGGSMISTLSMDGRRIVSLSFPRPPSLPTSLKLRRLKKAVAVEKNGNPGY